MTMTLLWLVLPLLWRLLLLSPRAVVAIVVVDEGPGVVGGGVVGGGSCPVAADGRLDCSNSRLDKVPPDLPRFGTVKLDLAQNNISRLPDFVFSRYQYLEELNLASNGIEYLTSEVFHGLIRLRELSLQYNNFTTVPWEALKPLKALESLRLDGNSIGDVSPFSLASLTHITKLWLGNNLLVKVPTEALSQLHLLEALDLGGNDIVEVDDFAFASLTPLVILILQNNRITKISRNAFAGLENLKILELNDNHLTQVPDAISKLPALEQLTIAYNEIQSIADYTFSRNEQLVLLEIKGNPLRNVGKYSFFNMTKLKKLIISAARDLDDFPDLNGTESLEILRIDRANLKEVPNDLCHVLKKLKSLDFKSNHLDRMPNFTECRDLRLVDMSGNRIHSLKGSLFRHQANLHDLLLGDNLIEQIPPDAFQGLAKLQILDLVNNRINFIHPDAFLPLKVIEDMNLGNNRFPHLPSNGLESIRQLKAFNNKFLKDFPGPPSFPRIQSLAVSYAYHCCEFLPLVGGVATRPADINDVIIWPPKDKMPDLSLWNSNNSDIWPSFENLTARFGDFAEEIWGNFGPDYTYPANLPQYVEDYFEDYRAQHNPDLMNRHAHVHCLPQPGPFMPCEDLFDWWTLRCGIWIVFLLAMLGNGTVVFVLVFSRSKMDVPRFLVCNLALADFFMGIYLGFLAVVDASTLGHFKMHAIRWQTSAGCQTAGFLGVLSSELSVFTLAVITLERNYAITHAMHLNKRLSLKHAAYIMACGWTFAGIVASLPLFGISDYRKFAICLPFEIEDSWSLAYVVFLMSVNGVAFLILMGCYLKMYCAIRGSQAWNSNDSRIAKRMALLVFTDFICWAPIAFFSLTAAFGLHLISLEEAKVFTIFVLPLNSCANPFLYAILTKQFKKDCVLICKAIEESRVTRGIGRCRHSSNFSNRQTPANTNSVVDRNSSNNGQVCSCNLKSGESEKSVRKPWKFSSMRYLLCDAGEHEQDSSNDYAYALAEIQRGQQKHKRDSSVSSENFSSSRSDSWRNRSVPVRLLEKRRRNSWTITRKPSQDSNLSNSRNDSSATTASTSTWRISRSSVSSDGSATRPGMNPTAKAGDGVANTLVAPTRFGSFRDRPQGALQSPPSRALPQGARPRPKLQRQSAVTEDLTLVRMNSFDSQMGKQIPESRIPEAGGETTDEDYPCTDDESNTITKRDVTLPPVGILRDKGRGVPSALSVIGFVPRKLSTISSKSCSMNCENSVVGTAISIEDPSPLPPPPPLPASAKRQTFFNNPRSLSLLNLPSNPNPVPRRYASDDSLRTPTSTKPPTTVRGMDVSPRTAMPHPAIRNYPTDVPSSDEDDVFDDGPRAKKSRETGQLLRLQSSVTGGGGGGGGGASSKENQPLLDDAEHSALEPT